MSGSSSSIRASEAETSSLEVSSPARINPASSSAGRNSKSADTGRTLLLPAMTATAEVQSGLEGVVAFATEIAEPDRAGGSLRYRGVDIEDLVGTVPFEQVWGLLVDDALLPGMPPAEPNALSVHSGDPRVDVQTAL